MFVSIRDLQMEGWGRKNTGILPPGTTSNKVANSHEICQRNKTSIVMRTAKTKLQM
jgi:hypothetical protein